MLLIFIIMVRLKRILFLVHINCSRCKDSNFSISIKYEYPDEDELKELGFKDISNAFTWITISLTCNNCGKKYKKFIDFES